MAKELQSFRRDFKEKALPGYVVHPGIERSSALHMEGAFLFLTNFLPNEKRTINQP